MDDDINYLDCFNDIYTVLYTVKVEHLTSACYGYQETPNPTIYTNLILRLGGMAMYLTHQETLLHLPTHEHFKKKKHLET